MQLPLELKETLSARVIADIEQWWNSLTPGQRQELEDAEKLPVLEHGSLPNLDDLDPDNEHYPLYHYLVNHELRTVGYVADAQKDNFHKFATTYLAALGTDYRHGGRGTVRQSAVISANGTANCPTHSNQKPSDNNVMHAKPVLRVVQKWMINRPGSVITDVIRLQNLTTILPAKRINFVNFKQYLRLVARDAGELLNSFETPPPFEIWENPVTDRAQEFDSLFPHGGRSLIAGEIFRNCNAHDLCDDGHFLVDGGINSWRRLWLIYQFHSLSDYDDGDNYTTVTGLISVVTTDLLQSDLFFGFGWKQSETLSRLVVDEPDTTLNKTILNKSAWRAVHTLTH